MKNTYMVKDYMIKNYLVKENKINNFMILSERCAGSHFVQYAMMENFNINYLSNHHKQKHFFGYNNDIYSQEEIDTTLLICVVRDPIEWIDSFFKRLHHVPDINKKNIENFIKNEWYSIYEEGENNGKEILEDRHIFTKERYKNIFELRKTKHDYFLNFIKHHFKHVLILRYEDLRDDYKNTMDDIKNLFDLKPKHENYKEIIKYKGSFNALYAKKPILLSEEIKDYIKKNVDLEQEQKLGYLV